MQFVHYYLLLQVKGVILNAMLDEQIGVFIGFIPVALGSHYTDQYVNDKAQITRTAETTLFVIFSP